ncbi:MAG: hypothetical protein KGJ10_06755 [Acidobacteriota bacterium]|nr:hypothetical protein [Acidobacteriota bacterium]
MAITSLRVGFFTAPLVLHVAEQLGRFADAQLAIDQTAVVSSPAQFTSLEAGEFDVVFTSPDNVLAYRFLPDNPLGRLLDVTILAGVDRGLGLSLWTKPELNDVGELRDQVVAVDVPQSGFAFVAFALLERAGLTPGNYRVESLGSTPRRAKALVEGACAATILNAGNELWAEGRGCHFVGAAPDLGPYLGTVLAAMPTDDAAQRRARERFVEVILATSRDLVTGALDEVALEVASRTLGLDDDASRAHLAVLRNADNGLIPDGSLSRAALTTLVTLRRQFRDHEQLDLVERSLDDLSTPDRFVA